MIFHPEKLSSIILKARSKKGYSQIFMAKQLGISQKTYSYIESGHSMPDIIKFLKIAYHTELHPMHFIAKISEGNSAWDCGDLREIEMSKEIEKLEAHINYLKSQNIFLKETVAKQLEKLLENNTGK